MPSRVATSAGFWRSTSVCHSTSCQRSGSDAKARCGRGALEPLDGGVAERHPEVEQGEVVGGVQPGGHPDPVDVEPADRGQQVRRGTPGPDRPRAAGPAAPWRTPRRRGRRRRPPTRAGDPGGGPPRRGGRRARRRRRCPRSAPRRSAPRRSGARRRSRGGRPRWFNARAPKDHGEDHGLFPVPASLVPDVARSTLGRPMTRGADRGMFTTPRRRGTTGVPEARGSCRRTAGGLAPALRGSRGGPSPRVGHGRRVRVRGRAAGARRDLAGGVARRARHHQPDGQRRRARPRGHPGRSPSPGAT